MRCPLQRSIRQAVAARRSNLAFSWQEERAQISFKLCRDHLLLLGPPRAWYESRGVDEERGGGETQPNEAWMDRACSRIPHSG